MIPQMLCDNYPVAKYMCVCEALSTQRKVKNQMWGASKRYWQQHEGSPYLHGEPYPLRIAVFNDLVSSA